MEVVYESSPSYCNCTRRTYLIEQVPSYTYRRRESKPENQEKVSEKKPFGFSTTRSRNMINMGEMCNQLIVIKEVETGGYDHDDMFMYITGQKGRKFNAFFFFFFMCFSWPFCFCFPFSSFSKSIILSLISVLKNNNNKCPHVYYHLPTVKPIYDGLPFTEPVSVSVPVDSSSSSSSGHASVIWKYIYTWKGWLLFIQCYRRLRLCDFRKASVRPLAEENIYIKTLAIRNHGKKILRQLISYLDYYYYCYQYHRIIGIIHSCTIWFLSDGNPIKLAL